MYIPKGGDTWLTEVFTKLKKHPINPKNGNHTNGNHANGKVSLDDKVADKVAEEEATPVLAKDITVELIGP